MGESGRNRRRAHGCGGPDGWSLGRGGIADGGAGRAARRAGALQRGADLAGQARGGAAGRRGPDRRRASVAGGRAGGWQNHAGPGAGPLDRRELPSDPVHERPVAQRRARRPGPRDARRPTHGVLCLPAGADLRERRPRRRGEPRQSEDPVGPARGDERGIGQHRRRPARIAAALLRRRHAESP